MSFLSTLDLQRGGPRKPYHRMIYSRSQTNSRGQSSTAVSAASIFPTVYLFLLVFFFFFFCFSGHATSKLHPADPQPRLDINTTKLAGFVNTCNLRRRKWGDLNKGHATPLQWPPGEIPVRLTRQGCFSKTPSNNSSCLSRY